MMKGRDLFTVLILAAAIAAVSVALVVTMPSGTTDMGPSDTVSPAVPETEPEAESSQYPEGISFDQNTGVLSSDESVTWYIVDELTESENKVRWTYVGNSVTFDPGLYTVTVGNETFNVIMGGVHTNTVSWNYWFKGTSYDVSVTYDIDLSELAELTLENREQNRYMSKSFSNLPSLVYVNDTVCSIVAQLEKRFVEIGGDLSDRQSYADFLVSFAQLGIKYPNWVDGSSDKQVWGIDEYWAKSLETLFFMKGDCEDSAAAACSLFKAAGYRTAMIGVSGHVTAAVSLEEFTEVDMTEVSSHNLLYKTFTLAKGTSAVADDPQDIVYYGVDTTKKQVPVGYMLNGSVNNIGKNTKWGTAGFYPVTSDRRRRYPFVVKRLRVR